MNDFVFQWPRMLVLLLLIIPLAGLLAFARKRRRQVVEAMGESPLEKRRLTDWLRLGAFTLMILALAKPGYAPEIEPFSSTGRDVVFVLDVSQSMLARDVLPSRLEVAKEGVRDALAMMRNQRVGLVVYGGSASILCPLTHDYDFVRYMLDQANPRTVDFGGTALQSAVEKAADQVFIEGREGVEDLVVLTDGGDNDSQVAKMTELLDQKQVDVLLVGIGDPDNDSPIPVTDEKGATRMLEEDGATIYTRLDDAAMRSFAAGSGRVNYLSVGTSPFNLGEIYQEYATGRRTKAADTDEGLRVYHEAALFFLLPALLLLLLAERPSMVPGQAMLLLAFIIPSQSRAATPAFDEAFRGALKLMEANDFQQAAENFSDLHQGAAAQTASPGELAAVQFNRGLCLIREAESLPEESAAEALAQAREARDAFLAAKRGAPDLQRAGARLQMTAALIGQLKISVAKQEEAAKKVQEEIKLLVERLKALLKDQDALRAEVGAKDVPRRPPPKEGPAEAAALSTEFGQKEAVMLGEAAAITVKMEEIDKKLSVPAPGETKAESFLGEPLDLMKQVQEKQAQAGDQLKDWQSWPQARDSQQNASELIAEVLKFFAGDSGQSSEEGDEMEDSEDYGEESDQESKSMASSDPAKGDLSAEADMQALPVPNYSADDILSEEKGSLQFRQQKRASTNAGKVKKDY